MDRTARGSHTVRAVVLATALTVVAVASDVQPRPPGARAACPVCGMFVAPHPAWTAQIVFADGSAVFFDGCKDLFKFLTDRERYATLDRPAGAVIAAVFVTGYYDQKPISAREAFFVSGGDVLGPMGAELIPLANRDEADEFMRDHRGTRVLRFDEINTTVVSTLD